MDKNSTLGFGKYRDRTIEDVWTGRIESNESEVIKNYLQEIDQRISLFQHLMLTLIHAKRSWNFL